MLILALESTAQIASAALWQDGEMLALSSLSSGNTHSTTLLTGGPAASASYVPAEHLSVANLSSTLTKMRRSYQPELHDPFPWAGQER